jgi:hypothetical protein
MCKSEARKRPGVFTTNDLDASAQPFLTAVPRLPTVDPTSRESAARRLRRLAGESSVLILRLFAALHMCVRLGIAAMSLGEEKHVVLQARPNAQEAVSPKNLCQAEMEGAAKNENRLSGWVYLRSDSRLLLQDPNKHNPANNDTNNAVRHNNTKAHERDGLKGYIPRYQPNCLFQTGMLNQLVPQAQTVRSAARDRVLKILSSDLRCGLARGDADLEH